ncbi:mitogen-activated protein kinase-like protein [Leishmania tarentolae]|uniref:Mitogen-activated protein kinase-like protein n=1 Tax=Leishmania tarentolae TaxID=5689 RepID=A0A640KUW7_LEITA|nr:mitogen-activated protein kinase-like protein [Leishmania tarentolae]
MSTSSSERQPGPEATQRIELPDFAPELKQGDPEASSSLHPETKEANPLVLTSSRCSVIGSEKGRKVDSRSNSRIVSTPQPHQRMGDTVGPKVSDPFSDGSLPGTSSEHRRLCTGDGAVSVDCQHASDLDAATKCPEDTRAWSGSPTWNPRGENGVIAVRENHQAGELGSSSRRLGKESTPAVTGEEGLVFSEYEGVPTDAAVRQTLDRVRSKNCILMMGLLIIIIVLAVAGGVGVGFVNKHYTTLTHRMHLESGERIVLNSSIMLLKNYHETLRRDARHLMTFVRSSLLSSTGNEVAVLQERLYASFFDAWRTWLYSSNAPSMHSIYIFLCENPMMNPDCPVVALAIVCMPNTSRMSCFYMSSAVMNRSQMAVNTISFSETGAPYIGDFYTDVPMKMIFVPNQSKDNYSYFLDSDCASSLDDKAYTTLTIRQQASVEGYLVMCDASSFFHRWFQRFEKGLQKKKNSYSVLFSNEGMILAFDCGGTKPCGPQEVLPCGVKKVQKKAKGSLNETTEMVVRIVNTFLEEMKTMHTVKRTGFLHSHITLTKRVDNYIVVYQDFLNFRTSEESPETVFIAAYAVPLDTSLGRDGFVQISICVVIIIICMFLLGGVAMVAVNQMLRVVEVISQLSTHAATYDTKRMRSVLDRQKPGLLARVITSADIINREFQHILTNLNAYRPFLPQSLLTKSSYSFPDEPLKSLRLRRGEAALDGNNADNVTINEDGVFVKSVPRFHMKNTFEGSVSNPIENSRLLQRGFHRTKSTILVVSLSNVALDAGDSVDVVDLFVQTVLNHAASANGVVEVIEFQKIVISFNSHFPVPRHQEKACLCALSMREKFRDRGCNVSIGIASGYNYVGTTGTDQQKARIIMGESLVVAQSLTSLKHYLGCSILATDQVIFEALVTAVAVDVVQLYYEHNHQWVQYGVSEIIGNRYAVLSADMQLVKSVFKMVRYRQAEEALDAVRAYIDAAAEQQETPSWPVRRVHALVEQQQQLIKNGYRRRHLQWQALEGDDVIMNHLSEESQLYKLRQQHRFTTIASSATVDSLSTFSVHPKMTTDEFGVVSRDTFNVGSEAALARALMGEQSKLIMTRRQLVPGPSSYFSEDALFPVFTVKSSEADEEDRSQDSISSWPYGRRTDDIAGASNTDSEERGRALLVEPQTLPSKECAAGSMRTLLTPSKVPPVSHVLPSHAIECPYRNAGICSIHANSKRGSAVDRQRNIVSNSHNDATFNAGAYVTSGARGGSSRGKYSIATSLATTTAGNLGRTGDLKPKQCSENAASLPKMYCSHKLPHRIVSVNGQVFHRTSQLVGRGSFGDVYLSISETGSLGAMKVFPLNDNNAPQLIREVETLSRMRHENIVGYDCCAVQDNFFFIICEYVAAGTLGSLIQKLGVIPERAARKYACDVLFGLGYLHQHSWLHCDIKPENILVTSDGTCKLADFGTASLGRSLWDAVSVRGTPRFSAPEAILGTWNQQTDIYSFGITVAQMVTGVHPWHNYTEPDHLFVAHYVGEIRHSLQTGMPCGMQPDLPTNLQDKELQKAIHRCCEFDPARRPTAEELVTLLS